MRNIVSRGNVDNSGKRPDLIRSPETFFGAINLVNEIADGSNNIYEFLVNNKPRSSFAREQTNEERTKAMIIKHRPELKELIWKIEDNELLRGRISFVLDCINYDNIPYNLDGQLLLKVQHVFEKYFNKEEDSPSDLFRRAMLTIEVNGEYECYNYWWSLWSPVPNSTKRKLFVTFRELEYYIYNSEQSDYFKKMVLTLAEKDYRAIINDFVPPRNMANWKIRLIKEDGLLKNKCSSCYVAIINDGSSCFLLKSQRPREKEGNIEIF